MEKRKVFGTSLGLALHKALLEEQMRAYVNVGTVGHIDHGTLTGNTADLMVIDEWSTNVPDYSPNTFFLDLPDPYIPPKLCLMDSEEYPSPYNIGPRPNNKGKKGRGRRVY